MSLAAFRIRGESDLRPRREDARATWIEHEGWAATVTQGQEDRVELRYISEDAHKRHTPIAADTWWPSLRVDVPINAASHPDRRLSLYWVGGLSAAAIADWTLKASRTTSSSTVATVDTWSNGKPSPKQYGQGELKRLAKDVQQFGSDVVATVSIGNPYAQQPEYYLWATVQTDLTSTQERKGEVGINLSAEQFLSSQGRALVEDLLQEASGAESTGREVARLGDMIVGALKNEAAIGTK